MRRKPFSAVLALAALAAVSASVARCSDVREATSQRAVQALETPAASGAAASSEARPVEAPVAPVLRAAPDPSSEKLTLALAGGVDGDTLRVRDADGKRLSVRLLGVDAPESSKTRRGYAEKFGREAKDFLAASLSGVTSVTLEFDAPQGRSDKYGRLLAYVWLPDGTCLNERLVAYGYAWEYTYRAPYRLRDVLLRAQAEAAAADRGLWAPEPIGAGGKRAAAK